MLQSIIAAAGMCADGAAEGMYAIRHRFSARAASLGYAIGAAFAWLFGLVTPINFTVESITLATRSAQKRPQILYIVALSALPTAALGVLGFYSELVEWLSPAVIAGIISGVGIILSGVALGYIRQRPLVAGASIFMGFGAYLLTADLVLVIVLAVAAGTAAHYVVPESIRRRIRGENGKDEQRDVAETDGDNEGEGSDPGFHILTLNWRELTSRAVLVGALSLFALRLGAVVSYDTVNAELAESDPGFDAVIVMASVGSFASSILGGPPVETTPAATAEAPQPVFATGIFMAAMAVLTFVGLVGVLGRYIPLESIAGFLLVLGIPVIQPDNLPAVAEDPLPGGTALAVTAVTNPFFGIIAGEAVHLLVEAGLDAPLENGE